MLGLVWSTVTASDGKTSSNKSVTIVVRDTHTTMPTYYNTGFDAAFNAANQRFAVTADCYSSYPPTFTVGAVWSQSVASGAVVAYGAGIVLYQYQADCSPITWSTSPPPKGWPGYSGP